MNKKALLEALLKAQKNGTLKDRALVTKLELQLNKAERRYPRKCDNPPCKTSIASPYGPGKSVGGGPKGEGEYCSPKCAMAHEKALGLKPEDLPFKRSVEKAIGKPMMTEEAREVFRQQRLKEADDHMASAAHMAGHTKIEHARYNDKSLSDMDTMAEHVRESAMDGHKVHVTHHPEHGYYHVSTWAKKKGKLEKGFKWLGISETDESSGKEQHMKHAQKKYGATHTHVGSYTIDPDSDDSPVETAHKFAKWHAKQVAAGHEVHVTDHTNYEISDTPVGHASAWKPKGK